MAGETAGRDDAEDSQGEEVPDLVEEAVRIQPGGKREVGTNTLQQVVDCGLAPGTDRPGVADFQTAVVLVVVDVFEVRGGDRQQGTGSMRAAACQPWTSASAAAGARILRKTGKPVHEDLAAIITACGERIDVVA
ncbi:hypothetical protein C2142_18335 [Streptomyces sp. CB01881]|nr:hypothetical protein C2142_18335 [Streptomyces sp. CB01881]